MKNIAVTVIVGFITGLVISGILFDAIKLVGKSFNRVQIAWSVSKAERAYSQERFSEAINIYRKVLTKINPENKTLLAKTKNNLALSLIRQFKIYNSEFRINDGGGGTDTHNSAELREALSLLNDAKDLYLETGEKTLYTETVKNIEAIQIYC